MMKATEGREVELGLTIKPRQSRREPAIAITDLDFADDIALLSNNIKQARKLLQNVEVECGKIGLRLNVKKTKFMFHNETPEDLQTLNRSVIKQSIVEPAEQQDLKNLGCWICSKEREEKMLDGTHTKPSRGLIGFHSFLFFLVLFFCFFYRRKIISTFF